jgi:hypothetical protein
MARGVNLKRELISALKTAVVVMQMIPIKIVHEDGQHVNICKGCGAVNSSPHEERCWAEAVEIAVSKGIRVLNLIDEGERG